MTLGGRKVWGRGGAAKKLAPPREVLPAVDPDLNPVE